MSLFDKYLNLFIVVFIAVVKTVERVFVLSFQERRDSLLAAHLFSPIAEVFSGTTSLVVGLGSDDLAWRLG